METRANHILIGSFMLAMLAALFVFVIWLARFDSDFKKSYDIYFRGSVTGLSVGASVLFNGVPIGQVKTIGLVPDDPGQVRVRVHIQDDVPILAGSIATLDFQGLTGVAFVQIAGGYRGQPPIVAAPGQDVPIIPARPSAIQSLFQSAPELLEQANLAVTRVGLLFNEPNRRAITAILSNAEKVSAGLASRTPEMERSLVELEATLKEVRGTAAAITKLSQSIEAPISSELPKIMQQTSTVLVRAEELIARLDATVGAAKPGVEELRDVTVPEVNRLLVDLRQLTRSLQLAAEKFEGGPAQALLGGEKVPDYVPEKK
jgi:phospholipid/cholesterol/gamma-HCH transport system substrate-binding protein